MAGNSKKQKEKRRVVKHFKLVKVGFDNKGIMIYRARDNLIKGDIKYWKERYLKEND